jgi:chemotaxis protein histidine kinase CheA
VRRERGATAPDFSRQEVALIAAVPIELSPARDRFLDLVVKRIMLFEALRVDIQGGRNPRTALAGIISEVHKIAGVAATLGFAEAGERAVALEQQYRDGVKRKAPLIDLWPCIEPDLIALMDALEALLEA